MVMERRKFLFRSVQASALLLISGNMFASALPMFNPIKKKKMYFHYLLFWLRKDLSESEVKEFENFLKVLKSFLIRKTSVTENRQRQAHEMFWIIHSRTMLPWNLIAWKNWKLMESFLNILRWYKNINHSLREC
jgi:hypothetical protein